MSSFLNPFLGTLDQDIQKHEFSDSLRIRRLTRSEIKNFFGEEVDFVDQLPGRSRPIKGHFALFGEMWMLSMARIPGFLFASDVLSDHVPCYAFESDSVEELSRFRVAIFLAGADSLFAPIAIGKNSSHVLPAGSLRLGFFPQFKIALLEEAWSISQKLGNSKHRLLTDRMSIFLDCGSSEENRFLTAVSLIESILVADDKELSFKFAVYGAILLRLNGESFGIKEVRDLYSTRSELVHKGKSKKDPRSMKECLYKLLRHAVVYGIERNDITMTMQQALDDAIKAVKKDDAVKKNLD